MAFGISGESAFKGLFVLLLVSLFGAVFVAYSAVSRPLAVTVTAPAVNVVQPTVNPFTTGASSGESGLTGSSAMFMQDCPNPIKKSIPVTKYPRPASIETENSLVSYALMNGTLTSVGTGTNFVGIRAFNGSLSPTTIASLNITDTDNVLPHFLPIAYVAANVTGQPTANTSTNISVNTNTPVVLLRFQTPASGFVNATLFINASAFNNSAGRLSVNLTTLVYNFTAMAYQLLNYSHGNSVANLTLNVSNSVSGNVSNGNSLFGGQLVSPTTGEIFVLLYVGNATWNASGATKVANGSNTSIVLDMVSAQYYVNRTVANYSFNVSLQGAAASALNVSIYGRADNGNLVREYVELSDANRMGTHITLSNFSEIFLVVKNSSSGGNVSLRYVNGSFFASLNSTSVDLVQEAYPCMIFNGTNQYVTNHSITTDAVDISGYRFCSAYYNVTTAIATMTAHTLYYSPDNKTWINNGLITGAMSATVNVKYMPLNDTAARYVRVNTTSSGASMTAASLVLSCKS